MAATDTVLGVRGNRQLARWTVAANIIGNSCYYGALFGDTMENVDATLGVAARQVASHAKLGRNRRSKSAPRLLLHAPQVQWQVQYR